MMYAVVDLKGHQYIVKEGDKIVVDRFDSDDTEVNTQNVLALFDEDGKKVEIGSPYLKATVTFKVVEHKKGQKIDVIKFRRKTRYQRKIGFRPYQTVLQVKKIVA